MIRRLIGRGLCMFCGRQSEGIVCMACAMTRR
jgi:hypothetical protein